MATPGPIALPTRAGSGVLHFVWYSWRGITRRDIALALLLGLVVGLAKGSAQALFDTRLALWRRFISEFVDAFVPIMLLFFCLAVARNVSTRRMPGWVPFAIAAVGAVLLYQLWSFSFPAIISAFDDDPALWPGLTMDIVRGMWINVPPMVLLCFLVSFGYMYALDARRRADALRTVQLDGARIGRQSYESRLQAMQARVEPQFLFETLGQVEQLYESDPVIAERVLDDLIVYLRGVLPSLDNSNSTVSIELEIARAWLDIMKARAGGRLSWSIEKRPDVGAGTMPPMLLLPLIEHAVRPSTRDPASVQVIAIEASRDGEHLRVVVTDSTGSFAVAAETDRIADVRARLQALYGAAATLLFAAASNGATQAIVDLPYERDA